MDWNTGERKVYVEVRRPDRAYDLNEDESWSTGRHLQTTAILNYRVIVDTTVMTWIDDRYAPTVRRERL